MPNSLQGLTDKDRIAIVGQLEQDNLNRNMLYEQLDRVYKESEWTNELDNMISSETKKSKRKKLIFNFIKVRVRDRVNLLTMLPDIFVEHLLKFGEDAATWAEFTKLCLKAIWTFSNMGMRFREFGYNLSLKGMCPVMVFPDFESKMPRMVVRDPSTCYAELKTGDGLEYNFVPFKWEASGRQIISDFPEAARIDGISYNKDLFPMVEWWDSEQRILYANGKRIPGKTKVHELGFIPIRVIPNGRIPGQIEGISDVAQELGLVENFNELICLTTQEFRERLGGIMMVKEGKDVPDQIPTGPGAYLMVGKDGDIQYRTKVANPADTSSTLQSVEHIARVGMNFPAQRSGIIPSAIWTGRGINASQASVSDDAQGIKECIGQDMVLLNEYAVKLGKKLWPNHKHKAEGKLDNGTPYGFEWTFKEIPDGFKHQLVFSPLGHDMPTQIVNWLQLEGQKIVSKHSTRERIPGIDAMEEKRRIEDEMKKELEFQMQLQQASQGGGQGGGQPQGQELTPELVEKMRGQIEAGGAGGMPA